MVHSQWRFAADANEALRFARKADAETFIKWLGGNPLLSNPRPTEHIWMGAETPPTDWSEYEDDIADAIQDSVDMDWSSRDGANLAKAVAIWNTRAQSAPEEQVTTSTKWAEPRS